MSSYNFHQHVASDIAIGNHYLDPQSSKSQQYLDKISEWTKKQEMKLNGSKTK